MTLVAHAERMQFVKLLVMKQQPVGVNARVDGAEPIATPKHVRMNVHLPKMASVFSRTASINVNAMKIIMGHLVKKVNIV